MWAKHLTHPSDGACVNGAVNSRDKPAIALVVEVDQSQKSKGPV